MPDKRAMEKRNFYIKKIREYHARCESEAFKSYTIFDLKELLSALKSNHEKFENKCLAVQCDEIKELNEQEKPELEKENSEIDSLCLKLKSKISTRLDELINIKYALPKAKSIIESIERENEALIENKRSEIDNESNAKATNLIESKEHSKEFYMKSDDCTNVHLTAPHKSAYKEAQEALKNVFEINEMQNSSSETMRQLLNEIKTCEKKFKTIVEKEKFDLLLMLTASEKFDTQTKRIWERHRLSLATSWAQACSDKTTTIENKTSKHIPALEDILQFIKSEIQILMLDENENANQQSNSYADAAKTMRKKIESKSSVSHSSVTPASVLAAEKAKSPPFLRCNLCVGIHPIYKCETYKNFTLATKKKYVAAEKLCVKCLRPQHTGLCADANSNKRCPVCTEERFHNSTLCETKEQKKSVNHSSVQADYNPDDDWSDC